MKDGVDVLVDGRMTPDTDVPEPPEPPDPSEPLPPDDPPVL